ncbi:MAG: hypothetical protein KGZ59_08225 [Chitinophagaceae bacterium]|nr:hypothetical protein [Chitinophagaceae bacterium]
MKKTILFAGLLALAYTTFSQDLTKQETINYINKKLNEVLERKVGTDYLTLNKIELMNDGFIKHSDKIESSLKGCDSYSSASYSGKRTEIIFKPNHITKIDTLNSNTSGLGTLVIRFLPNTVKWEITNYSKSVKPRYKRKFSHYDFWGNAQYTEDYVGDDIDCNSTINRNITTNAVSIYYLSADPANANRLMKAFKHLIALYKAEDDPFGN